jgi:hypothetical protein
MSKLHWRPEQGYVGDVIPFSHGGRIWLFYLLDERPDDPTAGASGMPWALVSTTDFVQYVDHGVVLPGGDRDADDFDCYTGSVVADGDRLHLFYTGHNPRRRTADGALQVVCHATSGGDLTRWTKHPEHTFGAPPGYVPQDWRDPFVFRPAPDEPWQLVLAARRTGVPDRRSGVVARLTSPDLERWTIAEPMWQPHRFITQECPDVFPSGDWWYLVYSEFSDAFQTRYRIAPPGATPSTGAPSTPRSPSSTRAGASSSAGSPRNKENPTRVSGSGPVTSRCSRHIRRTTATSRSRSRRRSSPHTPTRTTCPWRRSTARRPSPGMQQPIATRPGSAARFRTDA